MTSSSRQTTGFLIFSSALGRGLGLSSMPSRPSAASTLPHALSTAGDAALAEPLGRALSAQWAYGFPIVPKPGLQLTHGFMHYPAGMQAMAATILLEVLPSGVLLDPFVGGGTTLVEAMRTGREVIGADVSPLALFTSAHQTWRATDEQIESLRARATEAIVACEAGGEAGGEAVEGGGPVAAIRTATPRAEAAAAAKQPQEEQGSEAGTERPAASTQLPFRELERGGKGKTTWKMWAPLKAEIERLSAAGNEGQPALPHELSPLWFCYAAAQQRAERFRYTSPLQCFDATVDSYCSALRDLRAAIPPPSAGLGAAAGRTARLLTCDARQLSLSSAGLPRADAILTSPPYAGVYDYLSHARESRAKLGAEGPAPLMGLQGTPAGRDWPMDWRSSNEMGARKAMKKFRVPGAYKEAWDADQRAWLAAAKANLRSGGRAALLVGDGENRIDALESTAAAAEEVGLRLLASATITSTASPGTRKRGQRRPEHILLLEAP